MNSIEAIQEQIEAASPILEKIAYLKPIPTRPIYGVTAGTLGKRSYDKQTVAQIEEEIKRWQYTAKTVLASCFTAGSNHYRDFGNTISDNHGMYLDAKDELANEVNNGRSTLSAIIEAESLKVQLQTTTNPVPEFVPKTPKVFISHKKEDKAYADALVNLINFIVGADGDKIFCSSVQGYGIKQSRNIMDDLKAQFDEHEIFMIIIHSPRYYQSAVCLNEMGAAWVMGSQFCSFLTKDCKAGMIRGVINIEKIYIDPNDDLDQLNAHLNDFKNDLVDFFGCEQKDENKWENARGRFIKEVNSLAYAPVSKRDVDMFETWYLPAFEHIFEILDINHFQNWTYPCAIAGNTILKAYIYESLNKVPNYIMSRPKHQEYAAWDALMHNLGLLIDDFETVYSQHSEKFGDDGYIVERFYKRYQNNPNYERDLEAYNEHVRLVSDMLFELARLCNLILTKIRDLYPDYKQELGILHIDNRFSAPDLLYKEEEISDSPYPGLKEYIKIRLTRETHLGRNPNIDEGGYEI